MRKRPILYSILLMFLLLLFPVISGTIVTILELTELPSRLVQTITFVIAGLLGLCIAKRRFGSLTEVGLKRTSTVNYRGLLWFIPILLIELPTLLFGFQKNISIPLIIVLLIFSASVGFVEELYFRGIIPRILEGSGMKRAILLSSLFFSLGHFSNLLSGAGLFVTILQVIFAFIFGVVAIEIRILTGSLVIPIVWHWLHNFISWITVNNEGTISIVFGLIQGLVLLAYAIYLWQNLPPKNEV